ncbi:MAG: sigma-70 family RNA polymerase sigma factor [Polyangia bacterium]
MSTSPKNDMTSAASHLRLLPSGPGQAAPAPPVEPEPGDGPEPAPADASSRADRADDAALHVVPAALPAAPLSLEQLFKDHARFVAAVVLRVLGRDHEVDDVVQEVFLDAMSGLPRVHTPAAIRGWLKTVAVRKAYRHLRKRRVRAFLGLDQPGCYEHLAATGCGPEERALLARVYHLLDQIPVNERLAWTLRYVEGEQVEAVAALCGCSLATVKRRIAAASAALERMLGHG